MKPALVNKLYAKLTPEEQANLMFEAATRHDDGEINAITSQVERKVYKCVHADFERRINGLQVMASQYGVEYWKNIAMLLFACQLADEASEDLEKAAYRYHAKIKAQELALIEVCNQLKVDISAIKMIAGCSDIELPLNELQEVNETQVSEYVGSFLCLVK